MSAPPAASSSSNATALSTPKAKTTPLPRKHRRSDTSDSEGEVVTKSAAVSDEESDESEVQPRKRQKKEVDENATPAAAASSSSEPIYFKSNKMNGYACFSNFWPFVDDKVLKSVLALPAAAGETAASLKSTGAFKVDGVSFKSVEHYYQSSKFTTEHPAQAAQIRRAPTGLAAKQLNTKLKKSHPAAAAWFEHGNQCAVMRTAVAAKFQQNPLLAKILLSTGSTKLHESRGRTKDIWTFIPEDKKSDMLGKILMEVRSQLRKEQANK